MKPDKPRLLIAGGSGFLGQVLVHHFLAAGWEPVVLTRRPRSSSSCREIVWDGCTQGPWARELDGAAALINLAGKSVDCRYHARNRQDILRSRIDSTRALGAAVANSKSPPPVWLNASTATIYRHTFGPAWDESGETASHPEAKDAFSVEVALAWERTLAEAEAPLTRKVAMRTAMVWGTGRNSVFPVLHRLARLGLGGRMGSGRQFVSWIHQEDFARAIEWLLEQPGLAGIVNVGSPNAVTNAELMRVMRGAARMPVGLPAPGWLLEIGAFFLRTETELLIKSRRVFPRKLVRSGFQFQFAGLEEAVRDLSTKLKG